MPQYADDLFSQVNSPSCSCRRKMNFEKSIKGLNMQNHCILLNLILRNRLIIWEKNGFVLRQIFSMEDVSLSGLTSKE